MVPAQIWKEQKQKNKQRGQAPWVYPKAKAAKESSTNIKMFGVNHQLYNEDFEDQVYKNASSISNG